MSLLNVEQRYPVKLNPYCKNLTERSDAVRKMYLPDVRELDDCGLSDDGLGEIAQMPVPKFIRRYTDSFTADSASANASGAATPRP